MYSQNNATTPAAEKNKLSTFQYFWSAVLNLPFIPSSINKTEILTVTYLLFYQSLPFSSRDMKTISVTDSVCKISNTICSYKKYYSLKSKIYYCCCCF